MSIFTASTSFPTRQIRFGLVFAYPWNSEGGWKWPRFTKFSESGGPMKRVALSFNRAAIVFDVTWYLKWMKNSV